MRTFGSGGRSQGFMVQSGTKSRSLIRRRAPRRHGLADRDGGAI